MGRQSAHSTYCFILLNAYAGSMTQKAIFTVIDIMNLWSENHIAGLCFKRLTLKLNKNKRNYIIDLLQIREQKWTNLSKSYISVKVK
jgi:hypothetical protein